MNYRLYVKEEGARCPVKKDVLLKIMEVTFRKTGKEGGDVSLLVCNDDYIETLNKKYKKREGPTNVLSFSLLEGEFVNINNEINLLGDIVISVETVKRQTVEFEEPLERLFKRFFIHGLLHLLGYTHDSEKEEDVMNDVTDEILNEC